MLCALLTGGGAALAQSAGDAFTVHGVAVDVTAANPQAAKDQAIAQVQAQAFRQLLERLTSPSDYSRLPAPDASLYVREFSVESERVLATRYIGSFTVRFNPQAVRNLLRGANIAFAEPRGRLVVVAPVFAVQGEHPVLWDDPNPWRAAWVGLNGGGLVPVLVPPGDIADAQALSVDQALAGNPDFLQALSTRWRGADVMVVAAGLTQGGKRLDVSVTATPGTPKPFDTMSYQLMDNETTDAMMARAARDMSRAMDTVFKQPNLLQFDKAGTLSAMVPLNSFQEWLAVRDRLNRVSQVRRWELVSLSKTEAALLLHVVGDEQQVQAALANAGLRMERGDSYWTMRPTSDRM